METWNHNVFVTWFPVSRCALNKWQMLLSPQGRQRTCWIINHKPFWVRREKQLNLFATSCINLQPSCWSVVPSIMSSRGWWVQLHWTRAGLAVSYLDTCLYPLDSPWRDLDPAAVEMFFVFCSSSVSNYQFLSSFIQLCPPSDPGRSHPPISPPWPLHQAWMVVCGWAPGLLQDQRAVR